MSSFGLTFAVVFSQLDRAFEQIFNCFFYIITAMFILGVLGFDPFALLAAVSALVVGFAFMINIACSSWVNGLLLILVRRPYDVGDRCVELFQHGYVSPPTETF
jgi:small-conductance mechanosensitive channel